MKAIVLATALTCTVVSATPVASPYVGVAVGGASSPDVHFKASDGSNNYSGDFKDGGGGLLEAAGGIDFHNVPFRVEGALSFLAQGIDAIQWKGGPLQQVDEGAIGVSSIMINGYVDIPTGTILEPYLFAGIGRATVFAQLADEDVRDNVAASQIGAGLGLVLTDFFILDVKFRHFATDNYTLKEKQYRLESEIKSNQLLVGLRVRF